MMIGTVTTTRGEPRSEPVVGWLELRRARRGTASAIAAGTVCAADVEVSEIAKTKSFQAKMNTRIAA